MPRGGGKAKVKGINQSRTRPEFASRTKQGYEETLPPACRTGWFAERVARPIDRTNRPTWGRRGGNSEALYTNRCGDLPEILPDSGCDFAKPKVGWSARPIVRSRRIPSRDSIEGGISNRCNNTITLLSSRWSSRRR